MENKKKKKTAIDIVLADIRKRSREDELRWDDMLRTFRSELQSASIGNLSSRGVASLANSTESLAEQVDALTAAVERLARLMENVNYGEIVNRANGVATVIEGRGSHGS